MEINQPSSKNLSRILKRALPALALIAGQSAFGVLFVPVPVTGGFNNDVIADGTSAVVADSTTSHIGGNRVFYAADWVSATSGGLPANGEFSTTSGGNYDFGPYDGNNALRFWGAGTGSLTLGASGLSTTTQVGILVTSFEDADTLSYTLNFVGGASQTGTATLSGLFTVTDDSQTGFATSSGVTSGTVTYFNEIMINIDLANQASGLTSIDFATATPGVVAVYGVTAVPEPSTYAALLGGIALLFCARSRRQKK